MKTPIRFVLFGLGLLTANAALADTELFIETPAGSRMTVVVNDQSITNATGRFRFFDLRPGQAQVLFYRGNYLLTRQWVNLRPDTRTMALLHPQWGFRVRGTYPLYGNNGGTLPDWQNSPNQPAPDDDLPSFRKDDPQQNSQPDTDGRLLPANPDKSASPDTGGRTSRGEVMSEDEFFQYQEALKRTEAGKRLDFAKKTLPRQGFSVKQLNTILKQFSETQERLEVAKLGWDYVNNRSDFESVYDQFAFKSDKDALREYCDQHP